MKKSSMTLLSLLTCSGVVSASPTAVVNPEIQGVYQFSQSDQLREFRLCSYEMCQLNPEGSYSTVRTTVGSVLGAIALASDTDAENYLVFYPPGKEGDESARRVLRKRYLIELNDGASLEEVKERCGIHKMERVSEGSNMVVCEEESSGKVLNQLNVVANDGGVKRVEPLLARRFGKHLVPTDPYYSQGNIAFDPTDQLSEDSYQWYLKNEGTNGGRLGVDINVEGAWDLMPPGGTLVTGAGIVVGIVDDGVLVGNGADVIGSEELDPNSAGLHVNFNDGAVTDTLGASFNDTHGTSAAGLIVGIRDNPIPVLDDEGNPIDFIGMTGVAPQANFNSIRLVGEGQITDDVDTANALNWGLGQIDIYNNAWGPGEGEVLLFQESQLVMDALENGITTGRGGAGAIYVFSAGNDGAIEDNSNFSSLTSSQFTIAVGAITNIGTKAPYSEPGANLVVSAPSGGGTQSILTTTYEFALDDDGNPFRRPTYYDSFTGTSAAASLVSGVVALMLEANPDLTWRDVQDILIRTATKNDEGNEFWQTNADGLNFHHDYGAGLVNAQAAVQAAIDRIGGGLAPRSAPISQLSFDGQQLIPEGGSVERVFDLSGDPNMKTEHVELRLRVFTDRKADLDVVLISPSGTRSVLSPSQEANDDEQSIVNYVFMTTQNWGEGSAGQWILSVADGNPNGIEATFNDASLTVHGVVDPTAPVTPGPVLIGDRVISVNLGDPINYSIETLNVESIVVGDLPLGLVHDENTQTISGTALEAGIFSFPITLNGEDESATITITVVVHPIAGALGSAVEVDLPTFTGGDIPWDLDNLVTWDEVDAVRSGLGLVDGQDSVFGFNAIPDGVIMFEWAVSSQSFEDGFPDPITGLPVSPDDRLWFNFGGNIPQDWAAFIDGDRPFGSTFFPRGTVAVPMTGGFNNPRWTYRKDALYSGGQDAGYVDYVRFIDTKTFLDDVRRAGNINFDFEFSSKTWWFPFEFPVGSPPNDDPTGPRELLRTSSVGNGQTVSMTAWLEGPGTINYSAGSSTEGNDVFEFLVDGAPRNAISGTQPVVPYNYDLPEGTHYIEFRFRKDFTGSGGNDVVFLDNLSYTPISTTASWSAGFGVDLSDMNGDFDLDGYSNYQEYVFGGDPTVRDIPANIPRIVRDGSGLFLEFGVDLELSDLTLTAQESSNLEDWVETTNAVMDRKVGNVEIYRISVDPVSGDDQLYYRVIATPKP